MSKQQIIAKDFAGLGTQYLVDRSEPHHWTSDPSQAAAFNNPLDVTGYHGQNIPGAYIVERDDGW